jgi:hypothetical protein
METEGIDLSLNEQHLIYLFIRITRSEGTEDAVGDLNSDGRVTRSEARKARQAGFDVTFETLK